MSLIVVYVHSVGQTAMTQLRLEGNRIDEAHIKKVLANIDRDTDRRPAVSFIPQHFVTTQERPQGTHAG
jgi:hypothetical protein